MSKIPDKPQDSFIPLTEDYKKIFGNDLVAMIIYGSAAGGFYVKGKSDINLLVILTPEGVNRLDDALETVKYWRKRRVSVPWVMTRKFIESSRDAYPIEFLNLQSSHILIYGEDVLAPLQFKPEDLRLQIEKELKGKLILLREAYFETEGNAKQLADVIIRSITAFISIFKALVYLKQQTIPQQRRETIKELAKHFTFDGSVFLACVDIKEETAKLSKEQTTDVFKRYVREVGKLCDIVDEMKS